MLGKYKIFTGSLSLGCYKLWKGRDAAIFLYIPNSNYHSGLKSETSI